MKALTIKQAWAWAIAAGHKTVENRSWSTSHRGLLAIHSGANADASADLGHIAALAGVPLAHVRQMWTVRSRLLAVATLEDVCEGDGCECGPWARPGYRHWRLTDIRQLPTSLPCPGAQGLWTVPDRLVAEIRDQLNWEPS